LKNHVSERKPARKNTYKKCGASIRTKPLMDIKRVDFVCGSTIPGNQHRVAMSGSYGDVVRKSISGLKNPPQYVRPSKSAVANRDASVLRSLSNREVMKLMARTKMKII